MSLDPSAVSQYVSALDFKTLFVEELGWERFHETLTASVGQEAFVLSGVAHKRGAQVFLCACDSYGSIPNPTARRVIQHEVRQVAHHNLVVFADFSAATTIWQWAEWRVNERTPRVYEHAAANSDTAKLIERLRLLMFTLEEEEALGILDVARRLENAFGENRDRRWRGQHRRAGLAAYDLTEMDAGVRYWWERVLVEPHLTKGQEYRVACAMRQGNAQAIDLLIKSHLHLVARISWRVATARECSLDDYFDLVQIANLELVRITPGFNPDDGVRFQTYVTYRVKKTLLRSLSGEDGAIPLPRYLLESLPNLVQQRQLIEEKLMQSHWRFAQECEVLEHLAAQYGAEVQTITRVLTALGEMPSLDEDDGDEEDLPKATAIPQHTLAPFIHRESVSYMLSVLKPRQREIIQRRFGIAPYPEQTLEEIATLYGLTRERVRQLETQALSRLKKHCDYAPLN